MLPAFLGIMFLFLHLSMSTKHLPVSPFSGEKRKVTTVEMKLKIIAQLQVNVSFSEYV